MRWILRLVNLGLTRKLVKVSETAAVSAADRTHVFHISVHVVKWRLRPEAVGPSFDSQSDLFSDATGTTISHTEDVVPTVLFALGTKGDRLAMEDLDADELNAIVKAPPRLSGNTENVIVSPLSVTSSKTRSLPIGKIWRIPGFRAVHAFQLFTGGIAVRVLRSVCTDSTRRGNRKSVVRQQSACACRRSVMEVLHYLLL